jgi:putative heme-binding domain-containing protein
MWKVEDFAQEISQPLTGSNPAAGGELFTQLACRQCHQIAGDGTAYGPDLTEVFQRWKGARGDVLQQILEPSKVIEDRYRVFSFELKDGDELSGMILEENSEAVRIQGGPGENLIQTIKKGDLKARKQQILDLLAYLETGGKIPAHGHTHLDY